MAAEDEIETADQASGFGSRLGFVLSGIGAAVGLGNIWRFPQLTAFNGGAAFVFIYLLMLLIVGLPLLWGELSLGQRGRSSTLRAIDVVAGRKWRVVGVFFLLSTFVFFGYYQVIAGMALRYVLFGATDALSSDPQGFLAAAQDGPDAILFAAVIAVVGGVIVSLGVSHGLERANLVMMPTLFIIVAFLAVYALLQPGAGRGVDFYLGFDPDEVTVSTFQAAIGQVFFSVGIGFAIMLTFSRYSRQRGPMAKTAGLIAGSDLLVAFVSGLMIFPLVFSQGFEGIVTDPTTGQNAALFLTIPSAFLAIGGAVGVILMFAFFVMLCFAAVSSSIAVLEVLVDWMMDTFGWKRRVSAVIAVEFPLILGVIAGADGRALTWLDSFLSNILLFAGGIALCLLYGFAVKDRVGLLLDGRDADGWQGLAARAAGVLLLAVTPVILITIFALNLPCTINGLLPTNLPTPTC